MVGFLFFVPFECLAIVWIVNIKRIGMTKNSIGFRLVCLASIYPPFVSQRFSLDIKEVSQTFV
jgi:hypothetical protein